MLGSSVVTWSSRKQGIITLLSTEAKYIVATSLVCQAIWLKRLLEDMGHFQDEAIEILCDNRFMRDHPTSVRPRTDHCSFRTAWEPNPHASSPKTN